MGGAVWVLLYVLVPVGRHSAAMPSHAPSPPLPSLWCPPPVTVPLLPFFLHGRYINEGMVYDVTLFMAEDLHPGEVEATCMRCRCRLHQRFGAGRPLAEQPFIGQGRSSRLRAAACVGGQAVFLPAGLGKLWIWGSALPSRRHGPLLFFASAKTWQPFFVQSRMQTATRSSSHSAARMPLRSSTASTAAAGRGRSRRRTCWVRGGSADCHGPAAFNSMQRQCALSSKQTPTAASHFVPLLLERSEPRSLPSCPMQARWLCRAAQSGCPLEACT